MGKKTKKQERVQVGTSRAHRRKGHKRKGATVRTSKPLRIKAHTRKAPARA